MPLSTMHRCLDVPLSATLDREASLQVVKVLWSEDVVESDLPKYEAYLRYYHTELHQRVRMSLSPQEKANHKYPIDTHGQLMELTEMLAQQSGSCLKEAKRVIQLRFSHWTPDGVKNAIALTLRIWQTLNIRSTTESSLQVNTGNRPLLWEDEQQTLSAFLEEQCIHNSKAYPLPTEDEIVPAMRAAYLSNACGVKIVWTSSLADHLRFEKIRGRKHLWVYELKQCAEDRLYGRAQLLRGACLLPSAFFQEVLWTIGILFPWDDAASGHFLQAQGHSFNMYGMPHSDYPRKIGDYEYMQARLLQVHDLSQSKPENLTQFFHHRQSFEQRAQLVATITFGFILALTFGSIASATAIISARAALRSVQLATQANMIALQALALQRNSTPLSSSQG